MKNQFTGAESFLNDLLVKMSTKKDMAPFAYSMTIVDAKKE